MYIYTKGWKQSISRIQYCIFFTNFWDGFWGRPGIFTLSIKRTGRETNYLPTSNTDVEITLNYTSTPPRGWSTKGQHDLLPSQTTNSVTWIRPKDTCSKFSNLPAWNLISHQKFSCTPQTITQALVILVHVRVTGLWRPLCWRAPHIPPLTAYAEQRVFPLRMLL